MRGFGLFKLKLSILLTEKKAHEVSNCYGKENVIHSLSKEGRVAMVDDAICLSRATLRNIRENLFWAFVSNALRLNFTKIYGYKNNKKIKNIKKHKGEKYDKILFF